MSGIEIIKKRPFSAVPDNILTNKYLSTTARLVLAYLVGRPENWTIYVSQVQNALGISESRWASARRELAAAGYLTQNRRQGADGRWVWRIVVCDTPNLIPGSSIHDSTIPGFSVDGGPGDITEDVDHQDVNNKNVYVKERGAAKRLASSL